MVGGGGGGFFAVQDDAPEGAVEAAGAGPAAEGVAVAQFGGGDAGGGGGTPGMGGFGGSPMPLTAGGRLTQVIMHTVEPDSWTEQGGPGAIQEFGGLLIVKNSQEVHSQVRALLEMLRAAGAEEAEERPEKGEESADPDRSDATSDKQGF